MRLVTARPAGRTCSPDGTLGYAQNIPFRLSQKMTFCRNTAATQNGGSVRLTLDES
jgi:predicted outer membrane repeat protein